MKIGFEDYIDALKDRMDNKRLMHTMGVAYTAEFLMRNYNGEDALMLHKAMIAGFLHDVAKCTSNEELLELAKEYNIEISESEYENPFLLHGKIGAYIAQNEFDINDNDILNAISYHTTGRENMSLLEKVVFVADYIEPGRTKQPNLPAIRKLAFTDIDECIYVIAKNTVDYVKSQGLKLDETTILTMNYYKKEVR